MSRINPVSHKRVSQFSALVFRGLFLPVALCGLSSSAWAQSAITS